MFAKTVSLFSDGVRSTAHSNFTNVETDVETARVVVLTMSQLEAYVFTFPVKIRKLVSSVLIFAGHCGLVPLTKTAPVIRVMEVTG